MISIYNPQFYNHNYVAPTGFLLANIAQKITETLDFTVEFNFVSSESAKVQFSDKKTMQLLDGTTWNSKGFSVGDVIEITAEINNGTPSISLVAVSRTITQIVGSTLKVGADVDTSNNLVGQLLPLNSGDASTSNTVIQIRNTTATAPQRIELYHNIIQNDSQPLNNSLFDGNVNRFLATGIGSLAVAGVVTMVQMGNKSGGSYKTVTLTRLADVSGVKAYRFSATYFMPYNTLPLLFDGTNSLKPSYEIRCFPQANNPNSRLVFKDASLQGNTGYVNENYNQGINPFTVTLVEIKDENGTVIPKIDYTKENDIKVVIFGTSVDFSIFSEVMFWTKTAVQNQPESYADLISLSYGNTTATTPNYDCFGRLNRKMVMSDLSIDCDTSEYATIVFKLTPTAEFIDFISSFTPDQRAFNLVVNIQGNAGTTNDNNAVSFLVIDDIMEVNPRVGGEWENAITGFVNHTAGSKTDPSSRIFLCTEDDFMAKGVIGLPENVPFKSLRFAIEIVKDGDFFALQEETVNLATYITDVNGHIQIDFTKNYAQFLEAPDRNKFIVYTNGTTSGVLYGVSFSWSLMANWRDWIAQLNAPIEFFDNTLPNNGRNAEWMRYLRDTVGVDVRFRCYITDAEDVVYTIENDFEIQDYDDSDIVSEIKIFDNQDNEVTSLISDQTMRIEAIHTLPSGIFGVNSWGWISVRPKNAEENKRISTVWDWTSQSLPLRPLVGQTKAKKTISGTVMKIECLIDCANLPFGEFTIISRVEEIA